MKPLGLELSVGSRGPTMTVRTPSKAQDAIWEAVEMAINEGLTPLQVRREMADAWRQILSDEAKAAYDQLSKE